jgi:hypothetical protein
MMKLKIAPATRRADQRERDAPERLDAGRAEVA